MAASQKKVVVRRFGDSLDWGYLPSSGFVSGDALTLLDPAGRAKSIAIKEIKAIAYVRDFNLDDATDPERIGRRTFLGRPRGDGLWLRLTFRDNDALEGLASFDLGFIDTLLEDRGLFVSPPDGRSNTQRLFVPRSALSAVELLGMVTAPSKRAAKKAIEDLQSGLLFE